MSLIVVPLNAARGQRPAAPAATIQVSATVVQPATADTLSIRLEEPGPRTGALPAPATAPATVIRAAAPADRARRIVVVAYLAN